MIVDVHCHIAPPRHFALLEADPAFGVRRESGSDETARIETGRGPGPPLAFDLNRTFFDLDRQRARMDSLGIERSVLSLATPLIDYDAPTEPSIRAALLFNDELAALTAEAPDRFGGWAFLPMQAPEAAAAELRRGVGALGLDGGHVASNVGGRYLDDAVFAPVFDAAVELDAPLFVHPANPAGRERMAKHELAVVGGYLFDSTLNVFHMIFGGLLDRYPTLKLCIAHAGGFALLLRARMQREVDANPALAAAVSGAVGSYLERLWFDTICFDPGYLRYAAEAVGLDRFVLGSDGPFLLGEPDPVGFVRRSFDDDDARRRIFGANAARLFAKGGR